MEVKHVAGVGAGVVLAGAVTVITAYGSVTGALDKEIDEKLVSVLQRLDTIEATAKARDERLQGFVTGMNLLRSDRSKDQARNGDRRNAIEKRLLDEVAEIRHEEEAVKHDISTLKELARWLEKNHR